MKLEDFFKPKNFLGFTTLRNGTIILAVINLIFTLLSLLNFGALIYVIFVSVICTVLGLYGTYKEQPVLILVYLIFMIICTLFSWILVLISLFTWSILFIFICFLTFVICVYACCVINAYRTESKVKALSEKAVMSQNVPINNTSDVTVVNISANNVADGKDVADKIAYSNDIADNIADSKDIADNIVNGKDVTENIVDEKVADDKVAADNVTDAAAKV